MKKTLLTLIIALVSLPQLATFAQYNKIGGHLTIISETDEPFYLYINGRQFNTVPRKGIRIEDINSSTVDVKIVFPQQRGLNATHTNLPISDYEGYMQDITYSVNPERRGERAFMVYAVVPLQPLNIENRDMEVYSAAGRRTHSQYNDLNTRWNNNKNPYRNNPRNTNPIGNPSRNNHPGGNHAGNMRAMNDVDFQAAVQTIKNTSFDNSKLEIATGIVTKNHFTAEQIFTMTKLFSFESNKLSFAKTAYIKCIDPQNYHQVMNALSYSSSKTELNNYIQGTR